MKKKLRTIQPPHQSEKFTLEEAMEAWRKVEARAKQVRASRRKTGKSKEQVLLKPASPVRARVAADRDTAP